MNKLEQATKISKIQIYIAKVKNNLTYSTGEKHEFWVRELRKAQFDLDKLSK